MILKCSFLPHESNYFSGKLGINPFKVYSVQIFSEHKGNYIIYQFYLNSFQQPREKCCKIQNMKAFKLCIIVISISFSALKKKVGMLLF